MARQIQNYLLFALFTPFKKSGVYSSHESAPARYGSFIIQVSDAVRAKLLGFDVRADLQHFHESPGA